MLGMATDQEPIRIGMQHPFAVPAAHFLAISLIALPTS